MIRDYRLLFGPAAGILFSVGTGMLGTMVPGYSHIRQTVSEIGEMTSAARLPFAVLLCGIAICIVIFALALRARSRALGHSSTASYFTGCMAISVVGVGVFAYPHPLHNVFGLSELIGYQAPLILAFTWRGDARVRSAVKLSWLFYILVVVAIALNLSPLYGERTLSAYVHPIHGLVQRALFGAWFGWCFVLGLVLFRPILEPKLPGYDDMGP
jgi:hypothetical membrane protein